jgi:hypothetical protein
MYGFKKYLLIIIALVINMVNIARNEFHACTVLQHKFMCVRGGCTGIIWKTVSC